MLTDAQQEALHELSRKVVDRHGALPAAGRILAKTGVMLMLEVMQEMIEASNQPKKEAGDG